MELLRLKLHDARSVAMASMNWQTPAPPDRLYEATARDDDDLARCPRIHAGDKGGRERQESSEHAAWLLMEAAESGDLDGLAAQIDLRWLCTARWRFLNDGCPFLAIAIGSGRFRVLIALGSGAK
jgi:hypothetical protein